MPSRSFTRRAFLFPKVTDSQKRALSVQAVPHEAAPTELSGSLLFRAGRRAMACRFEILFPASERLKIRGVHQALNEVARLEDQMSVFRESSEICAINRQAHHGPVAVEEGLFQLLQLAARLHHETGGAFDITSGTLSRCWGFSRRRGRVPSPEELELARRQVGAQYLELDTRERTVFFQRPGLEVNLGSIGKGYALDRAAQCLFQHGIRDALLHSGHSCMIPSGDSPSEKGGGWLVSIRHPRHRTASFATIRLKNQAMATSGTGEQYFITDGKRYGHIIDPRSGCPGGMHWSATAVAPTATEADALSTAFFLMTPSEVEEYCRVHAGVGAILVREGDGEEKLKVSSYGLERQNADDADARRLRNKISADQHQGHQLSICSRRHSIV